jgi:hypothetical protein
LSLVVAFVDLQTATLETPAAVFSNHIVVVDAEHVDCEVLLPVEIQQITDLMTRVAVDRDDVFARNVSAGNREGGRELV